MEQYVSSLDDSPVLCMAPLEIPEHPSISISCNEKKNIEIRKFIMDTYT
jgi:hypothetical protein